MLSSQRDLFEVPRDICFLNAASWSPLPRRTLEAGRAALLEMELRGDHVVARDRRDERHAILALRDRHRWF